jgi:ABC-type transport system substrate-binding protein
LYSIEVNNLEDLYAFWHSSQRNAPGLNITNYTSTNLDKNLNIIKTSTSTTEIQESLESMVKEFYDEYPYIPLYTSVEYIYKKNNLTINSPDQISNKKEITSDIINWYKDKEKIWPIIKKYENQITKIYKLIH